MTAEDGVQAADTRGQFQIHVHAVVRQQHHHLSALSPAILNSFLQVVFLYAELPVCDHVARVGNRRVRKRLTNDCARHAVHLVHHIGLEHRVAEVARLDVLRHKCRAAVLQLFDQFVHPILSIGEFKMPGHHIHTQQSASVDHVLAACPQGCRRTLPGVAAIKQQSTGTLSTHAIDQRGQVRKTTDLAITLRRSFKVQTGQRMRQRGIGLHASGPKQMFAHQVRQLTVGLAQAQVHVRLAEMHGQQLRVAICHVQKRHLTETRHVVQTFGVACMCLRITAHGQTRHDTCTQHLHELAFG